MRPGIWDDTERSDDRLKHAEDRQDTGSWLGYGENAHLHFTHSETFLLYSTVFLCFLVPWLPLFRLKAV